MFEWLSAALDWLIDALKDVVEWVVGGVLDVLAGILAAIPVPDWLHGVDLLGSMPSGVAYFLSALEVQTGLTIMLSAYGLRFLIRRIPVIG